jgi:hypothetical protein
MALTQLGIFIIGVALVAAVVLGAIAAGFGAAVRNALIVWVLFLVVWYLWGPPLPYGGDWPSLAFAAIGCAIALCVAAILALWIRRLMGGSQTA